MLKFKKRIALAIWRLLCFHTNCKIFCSNSVKNAIGNLIWIKDLSVRLDTIKLLEENIGRTHFDINHSKISFEPPPRVMKIKPKINNWHLIKLKSFCIAKETINKKTTHRMGENVSLQNIQTVHAAQYQKNKQTTQSKNGQKI